MEDQTFVTSVPWKELKWPQLKRPDKSFLLKWIVLQIINQFLTARYVRQQEVAFRGHFFQEQLNKVFLFLFNKSKLVFYILNQFATKLIGKSYKQENVKIAICGFQKTVQRIQVQIAEMLRLLSIKRREAEAQVQKVVFLVELILKAF